MSLSDAVELQTWPVEMSLSRSSEKHVPLVLAVIFAAWIISNVHATGQTCGPLVKSVVSITTAQTTNQYCQCYPGASPLGNTACAGFDVPCSPSEFYTLCADSLPANTSSDAEGTCVKRCHAAAPAVCDVLPETCQLYRTKFVNCSLSICGPGAYQCIQECLTDDTQCTKPQCYCGDDGFASAYHTCDAWNVDRNCSVEEQTVEKCTSLSKCRVRRQVLATPMFGQLTTSFFANKTNLRVMVADHSPDEIVYVKEDIQCLAPTTLVITLTGVGFTGRDPPPAPICVNGVLNTHLNKCICSTHWVGETCNIPSCPVHPTTGLVCSGIGTCTMSTGVCTCPTSHRYLGNACHIDTHDFCVMPGSVDNSTCSGAGLCLVLSDDPNKAVCECALDLSRKGAYCERSVCSKPEVVASQLAPQACGADLGRGHCLDLDHDGTFTCACNASKPFAGPYCDVNTTVTCPGQCSTHGQCVCAADGTNCQCVCDAGYSGAGCNVANVCAGSCNHGYCDGDLNACVCYAYWGDDATTGYCSRSLCPSGTSPSNDSFVAECVCDVGDTYDPPACTSLKCTLDCGNGYCNSGDCACSQSNQQFNTLTQTCEPICDPHNTLAAFSNGTCQCIDGFLSDDGCRSSICQNSGVWIKGACVCPAGWTGAFCDVFNRCFQHGYWDSETGVCKCFAPYTGSSCNTLTCVNNRVKLDPTNTPDSLCDCPFALNGSRCEIDLCAPYGVYNTITDRCDCTDDLHTGLFCKDDLCLNGGFFDANTSACHCADQYHGHACQNRVCGAHGALLVDDNECLCNGIFALNPLDGGNCTRSRCGVLGNAYLDDTACQCNTSHPDFDNSTFILTSGTAECQLACTTNQTTIYDVTTNTCQCASGFTGRFCELIDESGIGNVPARELLKQSFSEPLDTTRVLTLATSTAVNGGVSVLTIFVLFAVAI